jgi:allantoate deiminase
MNPDTLTAEVLTRCEALARFSEEPGRLTRTFLRPPMRPAQECLTGWMREAGLTVRRDALGNLIGRRPARREDARVFIVGSHIDTVPDAGKYDGVLGVLLGVAAMQALAGRTFARAVDVIAFSEEEGVRYATPYLGSLAVCGRLGPEILERADADGVTFAQALRDFGLDPATIPTAAYSPAQVAGYLEVHIEQGPCLEALGLPLGVATTIVGQSRLRLRFTGRAGHAGTQPMNLRRDALAGAAAFVIAVEQTARATDGLRATVGRLTVAPGAINVVPGEAELSLDVRHADDAVRARAVNGLLAEARAIASGRELVLTVEPGAEQPAVALDPALTQRLADAARAQGHAPVEMVSGAGHDAAIMAGLCPAALLFLRSPGGVSHHPDESVRPEDVRAALEVVVRFLTTELDRH